MGPEQISRYIDRFEAVTFVVSRRLNALIRECIDDDLTLDQFLALRYIHNRGSCTASEMAETFCVNRSAITAITTRLADKRYMERVPDRRDRRVYSLRLTERGRDVYLSAAVRIHEQLAALIRQFPVEEIEQFLDSYERLADMIKREEMLKNRRDGDFGKDGELVNR